jgi:hypothetical protein
VARRSTPRGGRSSRKRKQPNRPGAGGATATAPAPGGTQPQPAAPAASAEAPGGSSRQRPARGAGRDDRPQAPWHPLPLAEIVILVGVVGAVIGYARGPSGLPVLIVGVLAVAIGTLEFTIREHFSGYRSHTILLASVPTALFHGVLAFVLLALHAPSPWWVVVPIVLDVPLFLVLFKELRWRFQEARRERIFAARAR